MKNVFYEEFQGESNGAIHFALNDLNRLKKPVNRSLDSFSVCFQRFHGSLAGFLKNHTGGDICHGILMQLHPQIYSQTPWS